MTSVLVAGAGPTGLTLACDLARRGVAVRIIDKLPEFPRGSRGKGLSQRTLEVLDDLGVIAETLTSGVTHMPFRKYRRTEVLAEVDPVRRDRAHPRRALPRAADDPAVAGRGDPARAAGRVRRDRRAGHGAGRLETG